MSENFDPIQVYKITPNMSFSIPFPAEEIGKNDVSVYVECAVTKDHHISYDAWAQFGKFVRCYLCSGILPAVQAPSEDINCYHNLMCNIAQNFNYSDELSNILCNCQYLTERLSDLEIS